MKLTFTVLLILAAAFGVFAGYWWLANQMPWWAFAAISAAGWGLYHFLRGVGAALREIGEGGKR